jgi:hypothetical protein
MLERSRSSVRGARVRAAAGLALLLSSAAALAVHNLGYTGMWWDEAAQFWISQGLGNYAPPFAERRGLRDVLRMNRLENLDPGGFSILLHAWTGFGRGLMTLRALPLVFFALGAVAFGFLGWRLSRSALFALATSAVPPLYPAVLYFGLEVRAYSMEMAGLAIGALILLLVQQRPSAGRASIFGLSCAAFLTARYSFIFITLALAGALWLGCVRRLPRIMRIRAMLAFFLPVFVAGLGIWYVTLGHQLAKGMRSGPVGIASPTYTRDAVLGTTDDLPALLRRGLLSPEALPITVCALVVLVFRRRAYASLEAGPDDAESARSRETFSMLYVLILGLQAISFAASAVGMYPWDITTRWSAYLVMLSALSAIVLAAEARMLVLAGLARRETSGGSGRNLRRLGAGLGALVVIAASAHMMLHRQSVEGPHRTDVALQLDRLPPGLREHSVFVAFYEVPMVRYLYEYGPYQGRSGYPETFRFDTFAQWRAKVPLRGRQDGIEFIVSALPITEAQTRFPGSTLRPFGPDGSRLLAVDAQEGASHDALK